MTLGEGVLVASAHWRGLYGHDAETGRMLWERSDHGLRSRDGSASLSDGLLYVAARQALFAIEPRTGTIRRQRETSYSHSAATTPLVTDHLVLVGTADQGLAAFDRNTFEPAWQFDTGQALFYTAPYTSSGEHTVEASPVRSGETLYVGASDGRFYGVDLASGKEVWQAELGAPVLAAAALSGELLFVADYAGNLYAFRSRS